MVVTGDMSQIDLPRGVLSGLKQAKEITRNIAEVGWIEYNEKDVMRHKLVQQIVVAYEQYEQETKRETN